MATVSRTAGKARPVRVGVVGSRGIPNRYGGFERFVELLVDHPSWVGSPFHFVVYGESPPGEYNAVASMRQMPVRKAEKGLQYYALSALRATRECDIVLSLGVGISIFSFIPRLSGKPLVVNTDGVEWKRAKWSALGRLAIRMMYFPALLFADRIVIDAAALREDFARMFWRKMTYIGYQATQPAKRDDNAALVSSVGVNGPFVLIIARLEPENNIEMIFDGFVQAGRNDLNLIIVGGTTTAYYKNVLKMKQADNVRFVGGIFDQSILNALRAQCSAYIHGHSIGGTPPSLIEALVSVKGRLFCHDNKYNREVAGERAQYFADEKQLSALVAATPAGAPDAAAQAVVFDDERYRPAHIAEQYREIFASLSPGAR